MFDVIVNGTVVMKDFDIAAECGEETAAIRKLTVECYDGKGIDIQFVPKNGEPVLNAIRIYRCF